MGKRSGSSDEYSNICRKMRKLERKLEKYRRSASSSSTDRSRQQREESPYCDNYNNNMECQYADKTDNGDNNGTLQVEDEPIAGVLNSMSAVETPAPATSGISEEVLDPEILMILGEDLSSQKEYGDDLHKDIAARWSYILCNGLSKESKLDIIHQYLPAKNCINMKPPKLNLEIEAALSSINAKKDLFSQNKQNQLSSCLAAIGKVLNWALLSKDVLPQAENIIKPLSDAGRLLSDCHYRESQSRRYAIINNLNKQTRDAVKNTKIDEFLFGVSLAEHLRSSKAISRTGHEMKSTVQRAPFRPQPPTTQSQRGSLNARGMARAVTSEPRQHPVSRRQAPAAARGRRHDSYHQNNSSRRGSRRQ